MENGKSGFLGTHEYSYLKPSNVQQHQAQHSGSHFAELKLQQHSECVLTHIGDSDSIQHRDFCFGSEFGGGYLGSEVSDRKLMVN